jgi:diguanylate cyclase (GGDEF)-like protein
MMTSDFWAQVEKKTKPTSASDPKPKVAMEQGDFWGQVGQKAAPVKNSKTYTAPAPAKKTPTRESIAALQAELEAQPQPQGMGGLRAIEAGLPQPSTVKTQPKTAWQRLMEFDTRIRKEAMPNMPTLGEAVKDPLGALKGIGRTVAGFMMGENPAGNLILRPVARKMGEMLSGNKITRPLAQFGAEATRATYQKQIPSVASAGVEKVAAPKGQVEEFAAGAGNYAGQMMREIALWAGGHGATSTLLKSAPWAAKILSRMPKVAQVLGRGALTGMNVETLRNLMNENKGDRWTARGYGKMAGIGAGGALGDTLASGLMGSKIAEKVLGKLPGMAKNVLDAVVNETMENTLGSAMALPFATKQERQRFWTDLYPDIAAESIVEYLMRLGGPKGANLQIQEQTEAEPSLPGVVELLKKTQKFGQYDEKTLRDFLVDPMTGAWNRSAFDAIMASPGMENASVVMADANEFKQANDRFGHSFGDKVLGGISGAIAKAGGGEVFRLGGDEFGFVIYDSAQGHAIMEKARQSELVLSDAKGNEIVAPMEKVMSYGVGERADTAEARLQSADQSLYAAKESKPKGFWDETADRLGYPRPNDQGEGPRPGDIEGGGKTETEVIEPPLSAAPVLRVKELTDRLAVVERILQGENGSKWASVGNNRKGFEFERYAILDELYSLEQLPPEYTLQDGKFVASEAPAEGASVEPPPPSLSKAASHAKEAAKESYAALKEIFGGPGSQRGAVGFDPSSTTYERVRPHLERAWAEFKAAGGEFKDFVEHMVMEFGEGVRNYLAAFRDETEKKEPTVSRFRENTLERATMLTDEERATLTPDEYEYIPQTSKEWQDAAAANVNADMEGVMRRLEQAPAISGGTEAHEAAIISKRLLDEARQTQDYSRFREWTRTVASKTRETARALKGTDTAWEKTKSPEGAVAKAQRVVDGAQEQLKKLGFKGKMPELTDADIEFIITQMELAKTFPEGSYEQRAAINRVQQVIANKIPSTWRDKLRGLFRITLLANPKTHVRNILGNVAMGIEAVRENTLGPMVDLITSAATGKRTNVFAPVAKTGAFVKGAVKGGVEWGKDVVGGVDTSPTRGQAEMPRGRTFKNPILNFLERTVGNALAAGDRPFYQGWRDSRIAELKKIGKTNVVTEEMEIQAHLYALEKVFQGNTDMAQRARKIRDSLGLLGEIAMPFTQTPANIFDKLLDYSPVGLVRAVRQAGTRAGRVDFDQKLFTDRISRSLTGTGIAMLGYVLAKSGIITGRPPEDKDAREFEKSAGKNPYAIQLGKGKYYTYDWMQPVGALLAAGADFYGAGKGKESFLEQLQAGTFGAVNSVLRQSFLQGIIKLAGGYEGPAEGMAKTIFESPLMFVPTLSKQAAQMVDPYVREAKTVKEKAISRIPFASKTLPAMVDSMGRPVKNYQGRNNVANVMLSPGFYTKRDDDPVTKMVIGLYERTGETKHFPRTAPENLTIGDTTIKLTAEQRNELQRTMGEMTRARFRTQAALKMTDERKIDKLQSILTEVSKAAKQKYLREHKAEILKGLKPEERRAILKYLYQ